MEISYKSSKLKKIFTEANEIQKAFGSMAKKVNQRMKEISASENLEVLKSIPAANCHELRGNRKGEFALDISGNHRIIFVPDHDPVPQNDDRTIDCIKITDIRILGTEDYH